MAVAVFDYGQWSTLYPELASAVPQATAELLFQQAQLYLDNTDASPVTDPVQRLLLLDMIVAHLATLGRTLNANGTLTYTGLVGRVSSATEGSVSVSVSSLTPQSQAWWGATVYGAQYWAALAPYRRGFYAPATQPVFEPLYSYGFGGYPWPR